MSESKNKLGMFSWFGLPLPLKDRLQLIADAGFHATTLWWGEEEHIQKIKHEAPKMVRDLGLYLENVHVPFNHCSDIWSDSSSTREHAIDRYFNWIDDCRVHDIPIIVAHVCRSVNSGPPTVDGLKAFEIVIKRAEQAGVVIAAENTRRADYLEALFSAIESPWLGYCHDTSHHWLYTRETDLLASFGRRLVTTHFSDTKGAMDRHWLPGTGEVNWEAVRSSFPSQSYDGCITLEVVPRIRKSADPADFCRQAFASAKWTADLLNKKAPES